MNLGSSVTHIFYVRNNAHVPVQSVTLPTATLLRNGVADPSVPVTVSPLPDLSYIARLTIPTSYDVGDLLGLALSAEHPTGARLDNSEDIGRVVDSQAEMFGNVARIIQVYDGQNNPISLPVTAFTVTPIIDGVDQSSTPVSLSVVPGGYYASFTTADTRSSASVHLRVRVNLGTSVLTNTFRMERSVEDINSTPLVLTQQRLRVRNRPRLRVAR